MSSNVFPVKPARSACHVPENVLPAPAKYPASAGPSAWPAHSPSGQTMCLREQCGWSRHLIRKRRRAFPRICHSEGALCPRFASRAGGQSSCLLVWDRFSTLALSSTMLCYFVSHAGSLACSLQFCGYLLVARIPVTRLWAL